MAPVGWPPASSAVRKLHQLYDSARSVEKPKLFPPWRFRTKKLPKQPEPEAEPARTAPTARPRHVLPVAAERSGGDPVNRTPRVIAAERKRSGAGGATVIEVNYDECWPRGVEGTVIAVEGGGGGGDVSSEEFDSVISSDDSLPFDADLSTPSASCAVPEYANCRVENAYDVVGRRFGEVGGPNRAEASRARRSLPVGGARKRADEWARVYACYDALEAECRGEGQGAGRERKEEPRRGNETCPRVNPEPRGGRAEGKVKETKSKANAAELKVNATESKASGFKAKATELKVKETESKTFACKAKAADFKAKATESKTKGTDSKVKETQSKTKATQLKVKATGTKAAVSKAKAPGWQVNATESAVRSPVAVFDTSAEFDAVHADDADVDLTVRAILTANIFGKKGKARSTQPPMQGKPRKWVLRRKSDLGDRQAGQPKTGDSKEDIVGMQQCNVIAIDNNELDDDRQCNVTVDNNEPDDDRQGSVRMKTVVDKEDRVQADQCPVEKQTEAVVDKEDRVQADQCPVEKQTEAVDDKKDKQRHGDNKRLKIVEDKRREIVNVNHIQFVEHQTVPRSPCDASTQDGGHGGVEDAEIFEVAFTPLVRHAPALVGQVRSSLGRKPADGALYRTEMEVFFRSGVLAQLEAARDDRLTAHVQRLQARCRGMLARRRLAQLRLHDVAVRCVQRNVRLLFAVRSWPWWRLLMRIKPLLGVRSAEQQLQVASEELGAVRGKAERLESERAMLLQDADRMAAQLSEMSADLADERAAAQLAAQRLDAESAHRARLERDLADTQAREASQSAAAARLEAELLAVRAAGADADDADDVDAGAETLRARLLRAQRELSLLRHRLTQQHADDLEQLVALKKQMEKKLSDVYEDVNAQRQTAAQAQRKAQKLSSESNDLRLHLEEQAARNALLEKKQRRFDAELQAALESARGEKRERERAARERDLALAEKTALEQSLSAAQLEVQLREDQAAALSRELDASAAGSHSELELASLRRTRHELESKLQEQEDELDDLAGQLAMLGQAKLRLEMSLEQQRKEARREQAQRDEELDEARGNASKKVKALEAALEGEHEERTRLLREKHELERRAAEAQALATRCRDDEEQQLRQRRELKRTRALLKDAQQALAAQQDAPNKALLRQLRHQLEDAEAARAAAARGRQGAEAELAELRAQQEEAARARTDAEGRANAATREKQDLRAQLEENEEELSEVLKKYGVSVSALALAQAACAELAASSAALETELRAQREAAAELQGRLDANADPECSLAQRRLELRAREAESRLELEQTTRSRLEVQISRLKESVSRATSEAAVARGREAESECAARRASRQLREAREAAAASAARDSEAAARRRDAEQRLEASAAETAALRLELRTALARVADLQAAMQDECSLSDSGPDSESDESIESFLVGHEGSERDISDREGSEPPSQASAEHRIAGDSPQESFA